MMVMKENSKWKNILTHSISCTFLITLLLGVIMGISDGVRANSIGAFVEAVLGCILIAIFFVHPFVLTLANIIFLFCSVKSEQLRGMALRMEIFTLAEGFLFTVLLLSFYVSMKSWAGKDYSWESYTLIEQMYLWLMLAFALIGIIGYLIMRLTRSEEGAQGLYTGAAVAIGIGMIACVQWILCFWQEEGLKIYFWLLPINMILIGIKVIREKGCRKVAVI